MANLRAEIEARCKEMEEMVKKGDYNALVGCEGFYCNKAHLIDHEGNCLEGKEIAEWFKKIDAKDCEDYTIKLDDVQGEGGWAHMRGSFTIKGVEGLFVTVWKTCPKNGKWMIHNDIYTLKQKSTMSDLKSQIQARCNEMETIMKTGDYDKIISDYYSPDAKLLDNEGNVLDTKGVLEMFKKFDPKDDVWKVNLEDVQGEGSWCHMRGNFTSTKMNGTFITVWKKCPKTGKWVIYNDVFALKK
jgi:hypothetical protein